jgi:N-ethylmaleimide reductase
MTNSIATNGEYPTKTWMPLQVGRLQLAHRVVMSPLTRARCPAGIPTALSAEYYCQRATKGGLIISEGIHPSLMVR